MKKKVFRSILLVAMAVTLICLLIILNVLYGYFSDVKVNQLKGQLAMAARAVELNGEAYLSGVQAVGYRLTWIDGDGTVKYDSKAETGQMENHLEREEVALALATGQGQSSRYSATLMEVTDYCALRLADGSVLRISASHASTLLLLIGMVQPVLIVALVAAALSALLALGVSRRILAPLNTLNLDEPFENQNPYEELSPLLKRLAHQQRQIVGQMEDLRRQTDEFNQITVSMKEGLVLLDGNGIVLSLNQSAQRLFAAETSLIGQYVVSLDRNPQLSKGIQTALSGGHGEVRTEWSGRVYQFDLSGIQSDGKTIGVVMLIFDVTDQVFAERNRREFTANVSHELKTPLQSIMGSAELMENGLVKAEDVPGFVGRIRREAARLMTLIEDILCLSELDEGVPMPFEPVDLWEIAQEAAEALGDAAGHRQVCLRLHGDPCPMQGMRGMLYEIVYNLCDNAIKYNQAGGTVDIELTNRDKEVRLTVRDTGIGIPLEHQSRIFERFYRVDKSHSKASGGTGLGLSIVKHAVKAHGGTIDIDSHLGKGTTIEVRFPGNERGAF